MSYSFDSFEQPYEKRSVDERDRERALIKRRAQIARLRAKEEKVRRAEETQLYADLLALRERLA